MRDSTIPVVNATASTRPKKPLSRTAPCMASRHASKTGGWVQSRIDYPVDRAASPRRYYNLAFDGAARADVALTRAAQRRTRGRSERSRPAPGQSTMTTPRHDLAGGYWKHAAVPILRYHRISVSLLHPLHTDRNGK
jgi:hypothetical protein